jgi:hypothetical protein
MIIQKLNKYVSRNKYVNPKRFINTSIRIYKINQNSFASELTILAFYFLIDLLLYFMINSTYCVSISLSSINVIELPN